MKQKLQKNKQPLSILALLVTVTVILCIFLVRYYGMERTGCVQRLGEYTHQAADQVEEGLQRSQNYMNKISGFIYDAYQDSEALGQARLTTAGAVDMITRLELLMPDGTLYTAQGVTTDPTLSFERLAETGTGILPRSVDQRSSNRYIIRLYTPIRRGGQTVAILCGVVDLERLVYLFPLSAYDGQIELFLMEGQTGSLLIDSWHDVPGNIQDFAKYSYNRGYSYQKLYEALFNGRDGSSVLKGPASSGDYYMCYTSVDGDQNWSVMLAVKEDVAFAQANSVFFLFGFMVLLLVAISAIFFVWFLWDVRQYQIRTDKRLQGVRYMQTVQQTLFRAHVEPARFRDALDEVAHYLAADATMFFSLEEDGRLILRSLSGAADKAPPKRSDLYKIFPQTAQVVMKEGVFSSNRPFLWGEQDWQSARSLGMRNMMLVRLNAMDGKSILGVLGAINTDALWDDTTPLDQVSFSFSMALANSKNYQLLAYMSQMDELTGVLNRNSYETRLTELADASVNRLGCIYIDANGLHEINNHLGHEAGDEMLRAVADTLLSSFDKQTVFRLGGDEFAVLERSMSKEEMESHIQKIHQTVEKLGYSVSIGLEWQQGDIHVPTLVANAETNMRQNKAEYYANHGGERQMRNLNARMEKTLAAKRDADSLLSYLAPSFLAVYFVDPKEDSYRSMVASEYLKAAEDTKGTFREAMEVYIREWVRPEDQQAFLDFCNYDTLIHKLDTQGSQDLFYSRKDGQRVRLRARRPSRAEDNQEEIMWIFTVVDHEA